MHKQVVLRLGFVFLFLVITSGDVPCAAQSATDKQTASTRAEVLVLGVYHMANPGHDIFNTQADDVLAPKRQTEMTQLIDVLKRFQPTKIALERNYGDKRIATDYADYLVGKHELTRNEIEQIGFRLAKELGHKNVYPTDADGDFPYQRLVNYAKGSGRSKELNEINREFAALVKEQNQYLASHTILETLIYMNSDDKVTKNVGLHYRMAHLGEPYDWAGADLIADWVRRNMRIYSNVVQLVDSPNERVLVIFGSGHLGWLQQEFDSDPTIRLRKLAEFAK